ncbi:MTRF1L release factor glutamine methyltransferase-like isoform X1 [Styela clava]
MNNVGRMTTILKQILNSYKLLGECLSVTRVENMLQIHRFSSDIRNSSQTYNELYKYWYNRFISDDILEPEESAGYIFAHLFNKKTISLVPQSCMNNLIPHEKISYVNDLCVKRLKRMPIQYILGEWDFFGVNLKMKPPVFIPRPETEELVKHVLQCIKCRLNNHGSKNSPLKILEIGCGSGAITLSLLHNLKHENVKFVAIDATSHAVQLSKENSKLLNLDMLTKLQILHIECGVAKSILLEKFAPFDIIVSNPPYIPTSDMKNLPDEISMYEDNIALHGGNKGLDVIDGILELAKHMLTKNGSIWLEVDSSHSSIFRTSYADWMVESYKDLFDNFRFCHFRKSI